MSYYSYLPLDTGECSLLYPQPGRLVSSLISPWGWKAELVLEVGYYMELLYLSVQVLAGVGVEQLP